MIYRKITKQKNKEENRTASKTEKMSTPPHTIIHSPKITHDRPIAGWSRASPSQPEIPGPAWARPPSLTPPAAPPSPACLPTRNSAPPRQLVPRRSPAASLLARLCPTPVLLLISSGTAWLTCTSNLLTRASFTHLILVSLLSGTILILSNCLLF